MAERNEGRERGPWLALLQLEADLPQEGGSTGNTFPQHPRGFKVISDEILSSQLLRCRRTSKSLAARPVASRIFNPSCRPTPPICRRCGNISCRAWSMRWSVVPFSYFRTFSLCFTVCSPQRTDLAQRRAPEGQLAQAPPASLQQRIRIHGRTFRVDRGSVQATLRAGPDLRYVLTSLRSLSPVADLTHPDLQARTSTRTSCSLPMISSSLLSTVSSKTGLTQVQLLSLITSFFLTD